MALFASWRRINGQNKRRARQFFSKAAELQSLVRVHATVAECEEIKKNS